MHRVFEGIDKLSYIIKELDCKKLMFVIDTSFPFLNIREELESINIPKVFFKDFTPNPLYEQVCEGVDLFLGQDCDGILAIGGGSAIDVAKCIKLACIAKAGKESLIPPLVSRRPTLKKGFHLPLIAIPTTAGTGSESTHNAVIYYKGAKQTVTDDSILPEAALLEPSVLKTLPLYQKKCTMMDALCQGIESWWSVNSTEESKKYSQKAVELIISNWRAYIFDNDSESAKQIMLAANYGGKAINLAQTTAAHAMSYKITSIYKLPHGHAVAICLPEIWTFMSNHITRVSDSRGQSYVDKIFSEIASSMGFGNVNEAIDSFREMMKEMDLNKPVSNVWSTELEILSNSVNPVRLKNNPVQFEGNEISALYSRIILHD